MENIPCRALHLHAAGVTIDFHRTFPLKLDSLGAVYLSGGVCTCLNDLDLPNKNNVPSRRRFTSLAFCSKTAFSRFRNGLGQPKANQNGKGEGVRKYDLVATAVLAAAPAPGPPSQS